MTTWLAEVKQRRAVLERLDMPKHIADWVRTEGESLVQSAADVPKLIQRVEALETALKELSGFAERNEARAKKAAEAAEKSKDRVADDDMLRDQARDEHTSASARFHEAVRVKQVIVDRVKEALAP